MHIFFTNGLRLCDKSCFRRCQNPRMKTHLLFILLVAVQLSLAALRASAHPGSSIVVDQEGNVYFTHTGRGCGKIDPQGKLVGESSAEALERILNSAEK